MQKFIADHLDAKIALDQWNYAAPRFDPFNTVAERNAMEAEVQAILSAKTNPADAVAAAQKAADELAAPVCRAGRAQGRARPRDRPVSLTRFLSARA